MINEVVSNIYYGSIVVGATLSNTPWQLLKLVWTRRGIFNNHCVTRLKIDKAEFIFLILQIKAIAQCTLT